MTTQPGDSEREPRRQVGALPFRREGDGSYTVLLVTSRESRRWVIPKGWPMKGRKPYEAAAREAYEEAGVIGHVGKRPLGFYLYDKSLKNRDSVLCQVKVFPLEVRKQLKRCHRQHGLLFCKSVEAIHRVIFHPDQDGKKTNTCQAISSSIQKHCIISHKTAVGTLFFHSK